MSFNLTNIATVINTKLCDVITWDNLNIVFYNMFIVSLSYRYNQIR